MPLDLPLAFVTERLQLRLHQSGDLHDLANLLTDRDLARGLPGHGLYETRDEVAAWLEEAISSYATEAPRFSYTIALKDDPEHVLGQAVLEPKPEPERTWVAGVSLLPGARGHGYGREAARAIVAHAFGSLHARSVDAVVFMEDKAAVRTAERLGLEDREPAERSGPTARLWRTFHTPGPRPPRRRRGSTR